MLGVQGMDSDVDIIFLEHLPNPGQPPRLSVQQRLVALAKLHGVYRHMLDVYVTPVGSHSSNGNMKASS